MKFNITYNKSPLRKQLEAILDEDVNDVVKRIQDRYFELTAPIDGSFVLFGAGQLGREALAGLRKAGIEPLAFVDSNPILWDKCIDGVKVLSPMEAVNRFRDKAIFVITAYNSNSVRQQLLTFDLKVIYFALLAFRYPDAFLPYCYLDMPYKIFEQTDNIIKAFSLLSEEYSRQLFFTQLKFLTTLDHSVFPLYINENIYYPNDLFLKDSDEIFVDCGAYDGDTIKKFLEVWGASFNAIIAIEPDPENFKSLCDYVGNLDNTIRNRIELFQLAISDSKLISRFNALGSTSSSLGDGNSNVMTETLDNILSDIKPTFIKMDIEGSELDALKGAKDIIKKNLPVLAVCLYHKPEHLWQVPIYIKSLCENYSLFLRKYLYECWDTILYAVPKNRLAN